MDLHFIVYNRPPDSPLPPTYTHTQTQSSVASRGEAEEGLPDEMSVIGEDDNIHSKSLQQAIAEVGH